MMTFDFALWLRSSSLAYDPDIVELREVDPLFTVEEAVLSLMRDLRETYVYKASVLTPYGLYRLSRLSLPVEQPTHQVSALSLVTLLCPLLEADGIDLVSVSSSDALGLVRAYADDPASLFALWSQSALAVDERLFSAFWNGRRSAEARRRLWLEQESELYS
jgi:hypothetical protein